MNRNFWCYKASSDPSVHQVETLPSADVVIVDPPRKSWAQWTELRWKPVESQWYSHPKDDGTAIYRNMGLLLGLLYMGFYRGYYTTVGGSIHNTYS